MKNNSTYDELETTAMQPIKVAMNNFIFRLAFYSITSKGNI